MENVICEITVTIICSTYLCGLDLLKLLWACLVCDPARQEQHHALHSAPNCKNAPLQGRLSFKTLGR